jgi:hypothetical protein
VAPRDYTKQVLAARDSLSSRDKKLQGQIEEKKREVEPVMAILDHQALWPKIIDVIHRALPSKDGRLVKPGSRADYIAATNDVPREERKQIILDSFETVYRANVTEAVTPPSAIAETAAPTRGRGRGAAAARGRGSRAPSRTSAGSRGKRGASARGRASPVSAGGGFVVTLKGWTPYGNPGLLSEFRDTLKELGNPKEPNEAERLGFHILMPAAGLNPQPRNAEAALRLAEQPEPPAAEAGEQETDADPDRDPVTGEIWVRDWLFTLKFGVALGPSPEAGVEPAEEKKTSGRSSRRRGR